MFFHILIGIGILVAIVGLSFFIVGTIGMYKCQEQLDELYRLTTEEKDEKDAKSKQRKAN